MSCGGEIFAVFHRFAPRAPTRLANTSPRLAFFLLASLVAVAASVVSSFSKQASAVLNGFLLGQTTGTAFADIIFGFITPSGKLPVTFPLSEDDTVEPCDSNPCSYSEGLEVGWRALVDKDVDFPFGHGLSYTKFDYKLAEEPEILPSGGLSFSVDVANSGDFKGSEVVQVYLGFPKSAGEPAMQMKAFAKTSVLAPDDAQELSFQLSPRDLQVWSVEAAGWIDVQGEFSIHVGSSSRDLRLKSSVTV